MTSKPKAPALHPDTVALLEAARAANAPPYEAMTVEQARETSGEFTAVGAFPALDVASVEDRTIGEGASAFTARLYRPLHSAEAAAPAILYIHGGGWVVGSLDSHDSICRRLCDALHWPIVAIDYRLAPEHRFPAAVDDTFAAIRWLHAEAAALGIDPARIAVVGDSAGGNLAAVAAIAAREGMVPPVAFQGLVYPVTDLGGESEGYARVVEGMPVTGPTMRWFRDLYLGSPEDGQDWRASPLRAASLADLPPALVVTMEHDPLCEEGRAYARGLIDAGGEVIELHFSNHMHGLISMGALIRDAEALLQSLITALRCRLAAVPAP